MEVTSEIVITITEIVTAEVDTLIAVHVLAHIQSLVEDLATNAAITLGSSLLPHTENLWKDGKWST